ncbi:hypothetical protein AArcSl_2823 [Halalkaliarchaeum desulfuricum]|uniref:Uncharacterized protein n=1 Tax=Halalkaliarchaeum desulfuricum TaxID=2055893 RepID=A0A343TMW6_9EURY|nr:hypothetical protein [Halalkaliarchaeum desulfuricum]AUX10438.1 hypothetical protein AArcSl_2823 [Halalkaliarchaeum desulfuricum]
METHGTTDPDDGEVDSGEPLPRRIAGRIAGSGRVPTSLRAALDHYADTGRPAIGSIRAHRRAEDRVDEIVDEAFGDVERAIAAEFDRGAEEVTFDYGTKLTMPVELTLAHVYADRDERGDATVETAEAVTELVVVALLDGDVRDALNDGEYDDFRVNFPLEGETDRRRLAEVVQATLQADVDARFDAFDDEVKAAYDRAVELSEAHQDRDPHFRQLFVDAKEGEAEALDSIREEYKFAEFDDPPALLSELPVDLPYFKTQYGRVGVIYDGMIDMYRAAGIDIDPAFELSIVLSIIGAQVWLDDVDDYRRDLADDQLTPVTAEYLLAESDAQAYDRIVSITEAYLDAAKRRALAADSDLVSIGSRYIYYSGDPDVLPR